jgi:hypothetical protein
MKDGKMWPISYRTGNQGHQTGVLRSVAATFSLARSAPRVLSCPFVGQRFPQAVSRPFRAAAGVR